MASSSNRKNSQNQQLALWEGVPLVGRPTEKPWGCPTSVWETIRKREYRDRNRPGWTEQDLRAVADAHASRPYWQKRPRREPDPPPQIMVVAVERVEYPIDRVSDITRRMIEDGRLPGIHWDPQRGGVRTAKVRRLA